MLKQAVVMLSLASAAQAQRGIPAQPGPGGEIAESVCGAPIDVKLDMASVQAAHAKLKAEYTLANAQYDAAYICRRGVFQSLERLCKLTQGPDEGAGAPPSPAASKVKSVRCVVLESAGAPHQQEFKDGVWTVKYGLWSSANILVDSKPQFPYGPNGILRGLGSTLGLTVPAEDPDQLFRGFSESSERCSKASDCKGGLVCGKDNHSGMHGPRCVEAGPKSCSRSGDAFGHADKACPAGQRCTQLGVCFPKSDFPARGRNLPAGARCYYDTECASKRCPGNGQDRFANHVGECARR